MKVCAIYGIQFTRMNCLRWGRWTEMVQLNKMCVIRGKQVCNPKCVGRPITTQTIPVKKTCVLWANNCWYTIVSDWWNHYRWVPLFSPCAMRGIRLICMNCLRWDRTTETGSQIKVCVIYDIQFTLINRLRWLRWTQTIQCNKMCVIPDKQVGNQNCVR